MKRLSPPALRYAVVRMDPVAMVEHLNDSAATDAARALCTKNYLVYLDNAIDVPFPTSKWFRFQISTIGTTLRPEEPERDITADMAIPVYPNEDHPHGWAAVRPQTPFPFEHCYHWFDNLAVVRVRRIPEMYDDSAAIRLSSLQHVRMEQAFSQDCTRVNTFMDLPEAPPEDASIHSSAAQSLAANAIAVEAHISQAMTAHATGAQTPLHPQTPSMDYSRLPGKGREPDAARSPTAASGQSRPDRALEDLLRMDVLNLTHDDDVAFLPLVDLWFDLERHLSEDEIPSPLEFYEERDAIRTIIREARARNPRTRVPRRNGELGAEPEVEDTDASDWEESASESGDEAAPSAPAEAESGKKPSAPGLPPQSLRAEPRFFLPELPVPPASPGTAELFVELMNSKSTCPPGMDWRFSHLAGLRTRRSQLVRADSGTLSDPEAAEWPRVLRAR